MQPADGSGIKTISRDKMQIKGYADCSDSLTTKTMNLTEIQFNKTGLGETKIKTYEDAFTHIKKTDCKILSCSLMEVKTCKTQISTRDLSIDSEKQYRVVGKEKNTFGYTQDFCYSCTVASLDVNAPYLTFTNDE